MDVAITWSAFGTLSTTMCAVLQFTKYGTL